MEHSEVFLEVRREAENIFKRYSTTITMDEHFTNGMVLFTELTQADIRDSHYWAEVTYLVMAMDEGLITHSDPRLNEFQRQALTIFYCDEGEHPEFYFNRLMNHPFPEVAAIVHITAYVNARMTDEEITNFEQLNANLRRSVRQIRHRCLTTAARALDRYIHLTLEGE